VGNRTVSVTLSANVAQYIAGMQAAAAATQGVIGPNTQLTLAQQQAAAAAKAAAAQQAAAARLAAQAQAAQASAAAKAAAAQRTLGASMANDISRQTQMARLQSQAIAENEARDKAAAAQRVDAQRKVGVAAAAAGVILLAGFAVSVKKAAEFEQAMSHVEAVTHASAQAQLQLKNAALDAGAKTVFTATESANAIEELAKAGVSTSNILSGGLAGALALASAGDLGVADAAEIASSAMVQFNLSGDKATHVADLLAAGANKAQGSVADLGMGLSYVGPVAASMGVSIEQTTGALALFANNGILAERGGTALRGILLSLSSPSKRAAEELDKLGINLYDTQGHFVGINGAAEQLRTKMSGLTEEQRNYSLGVIFSNAQVTSANVLLKGGAAAVDDWTKKVNDQGYAAETARIKLDNLRGDVEKLGGALDNAFITSGQGGLSPFRVTVQGITGVVNAYGNLSQTGKNVTFVLTGVAGAAGLAAGGFLVLAPRIIATRAALATLAPAGSTANVALRRVGAGLAVIAGLAVAGEVIGAVGSAGTKAAPGINAMTAALTQLNGASQSASPLDKLFDGASGARFSTDHIKSFEDAIKRLGDPSLRDKIGGLDATLLSFGTHSQPRLVEAKQAVSAIDQSLTSLVTGGNSAQASAAFNELAKRANDAGVSTDKLKQLLPGYTDAMVGASSATSDKAAADKTGAAAGEANAAAIDDTRSAAERLKDAIEGLSGSNINVARAQIELKDGLAAVTKQFKGANDSVSTNSAKGRENLGVILDQIDKANKYGQAIADQAAGHKELSAAVNDGRKAFKGQISSLRDTLIAAGVTESQVDRLIATYGKVPTKANTDVQVTGVPKAVNGVKQVKTAVDNLPPRTDVQIAASDAATPILNSVMGKVDTLRANSQVRVSIIGQYSTIGKIPAGIAAPGHADGGHIVGPGGPRDDMVPALLSNGEFVVNAAATARHRTLLESINAQRFADGGFATNQAGLNAISGRLQAQVSIVTDAKSAAADVAKAVAEVKRLQQAWKDTADAIDQAKQRRELLRAIDVAEREHRNALKTKDKQDDKDTAASAIEAHKALSAFDAQAARTRQSNLIDSRAAAAEQRAEARATLAANQASYEFDHKSSVDQLAALDARIKGERKYSDQWMADTQQREQIQAQVNAESQRLVDNQAQYEFEHKSAQEQLADIDRRLAAETQYSDAWISLASQREQVQKQINDDAQAAIDKQKSAVDQQAQQLNGLLDQQASLTAQLDAAQATYNQAVANIKKARTDVLATVDLTQKPLVQPGTSINNLLKNATASNAQFDEWVQQLALARRNGVSEAVIQSLGLDQGPQALGQLRQLNKANADQVGQLNTAVATRRAQAATQTDAEQASGVGAVAADIQAAADALVSSQADLNGQLAALGVDQGRTYADAIAQGLASGQAGVRVAALALVGGAAVLDQLRGVPAGTTASGFATGGHVNGPGTGTSDSVPAWLSNGEFVVRAAAVQQHRSLLETINAGHYADGGYVSAGRIPSGGPQVNVSAEVETWALQMEVRRISEALERQTAVIRSQNQQLTMAVGGI
jgi:TP901 family phage tail tape measure protein